MDLYEVYVTVNGIKVKIGAFKDIDKADEVYAAYIRKVKSGARIRFNRANKDGVATEVCVLRKKDGAEFSFSLKEGFQEKFRKAA